MTTIHSLPSLPSLARTCIKLKTASRLQYRTRRLELAPPAAAAVHPAHELPGMEDAQPARQALLVRLPIEWELHLQALASASPVALAHPDIGLCAQGAYISMSVPTPGAAMPWAIWMDAARILEISAHNEATGSGTSVPVCFAAGDGFVLAQIACNPDFIQRTERAISDAEMPPFAGNTDMEKARSVAERYGERPWLFMRYDVRTFGKRMAVTWAAMPDRLPPCVL